MPIVLYDYRPDRRARNTQEFLKGFKGYLHTDGYAGYHCLPEDIVIVGCWAHARREFDEALKGLLPKDQIGSGALHCKRVCYKLFAIERSCEECSFEERLEKRYELAKTLLGEFLSWLQKQNPAAKTGFGKAVQYTLSQWKYLIRYLLDGRLEISNNRARVNIRPCKWK